MTVRPRQPRSSGYPPPTAAFGAEEPPEQCSGEHDRDGGRYEVDHERDVADIGAEITRPRTDRRRKRRADHDSDEHDRDGDQPRDRLEAPHMLVEAGEADADRDL